MADDGIEAALIKEANPFIDDLAEAVVHALRRDKRTNLPYVQTYPELGLANSTTRQTLPAEITWLLLYSAANAAPDLTLDIQGIVIPVTSFPAQIQLPLWGATVTLTNNDSANNVTVVATDRPILPQVAAAGGSTASPLYAELTGSLVSDASPGYVRLQDGASDNITTVYGEYSVGNNDGNSLGNSYSLSTAPMAFVYNGTSWDRRRGIPGTDGVAASPYSGMQSVSITTATTTAVKASAGVVGTLSNASGATTGTITIYDNTSATGKTLWTGTLAAGQVLPLGIPCGTGITIVTAAADAIAVSYA